MTSTFFLQSERMDISIGTKQVPVAVLNSFNAIAVVILVPIMELLIYPYLRKINHSPTLLQRMGEIACFVLYTAKLKTNIMKMSYNILYGGLC